MKMLVPLIFAGAAVALAGCAHVDRRTLTADHTIRVKHPLNESGNSKEKWSLKKNGNGVFRLKASPQQTIEWQKPGEFYIVALNTNNWGAQKWLQLPGFECPTCGAVSATNSVSLTFSPTNPPPSPGTNSFYHYRIVVHPARSNKMVACPDPDGCDYDMVDAMLTWDG